MTVTADQMQKWCANLLAGRQAAPAMTLPDYLAAIPKLASLDDVAPGTPVLVRGDVDAKPGTRVGEGDVRLRSMCETLRHGRERGWKQVVFGHIGRKPEGSLSKVATRIGELLDCEAPLVTDWWDDGTQQVSDSARRQVAAAEPGAVLILENTRRYEIERVLWKATGDDLPALAPRLAAFANQLAEKIARVYVNEALSAGSLDASSTVAPASMDRVALGSYVASEFEGPMRECLDDLEAMISRGKIRRVFAAGSLAMALKKAVAELDGTTCCIGVAEDAGHSDQPYYIPPVRIEQAKRMVSEGRQKGIEFVIPIDSVIEDGSVVDQLRPTDQQLDIGPKSSQLYEQKVGEFIEQSPNGAVAFHNGVFGKFEDPRFEEGTKRFVSQLKRMTDAGAKVYVGGGEGGKALEKYGDASWVTHVFTAGGTVLNALGNEPVPYLAALRMASQ